MTTPLAELRAMLAHPEPTRGIVTALRAGTVTLATPQGLITAQAASTATLHIGDQVRIERGIAHPQPRVTQRYRL